MKKFLCTLSLLTLVLTASFADPKDPSGLFNIKFRGEEVVITGCNYEYSSGAERKLVVPAYIDGLPVTQLSAYALSSYENYDLDEVTEIVLPETLKIIGYKAFAGLEGIKKIVIPDNVEYIGYSAFDSCYDLNSVKIPSSVRYIDDWAFDDTALTSVEISRATHISEDAFDYDVTLFVFRGSQAEKTAIDEDLSYRYLPDGSELDVPEYPVEEYENYYHYYDDDDYYYDYDDDDYYYGYDDDEDVEPVTEEQLVTLVDYIVSVENSGELADGSVGTEISDGSVFIRIPDMLYLVNNEYEFPYIYYRIDSYSEEVPNFIYVLYGRPTYSNDEYYSWSAYMIEDEDASDYLENTNIEERWERINGYTITYRTTVKIDGKTYEVLCTDIDDDQDDYDDYYDDYDDYDLSDYGDWDDDEFAPEITTEDMNRTLLSVVSRMENEYYEDVYFMHVHNYSMIVCPASETNSVPHIAQIIEGYDGRNIIVLGYMRNTSSSNFTLCMLGSQIEATTEDDITPYTNEELDDLYADAEGDTVMNVSRRILGKDYDVYFVDLDS